MRLKQVTSDTIKILLRIFIPYNTLIFTKKREDWLTRGSQVRNEPKNIIQTSEKSFDLLFCFGCRYISNNPDFIWIYFYAFLTDDETQKLPITNTESAFVWIQVESEFSHMLKQFNKYSI